MIERKELLTLHDQYHTRNFFGAFEEKFIIEFCRDASILTIQLNSEIKSKYEFNTKEESAVYFILEGTCLVKRTKKSDFIYSLRAKGDLIFEFEAVRGTPSTAYINALSPMKAVVFPTRIFREALSENSLALMLSEHFFDKINFHALKSEMDCVTGAQQKLAKFFYLLAQPPFFNNFCEKTGDEIKILTGWNPSNLSRFFGWKVDVINKALDYMEYKGCIRLEIIAETSNFKQFYIIIKNLQSLGELSSK